MFFSVDVKLGFIGVHHERFKWHVYEVIAYEILCTMAAYLITYKFKSLIYNSDMQEGFLSSASLYFGGNKQKKCLHSVLS